ncbi:MAG: hypothetical protein LBL73_11915 [Synergistaceae bacterium]|jgi:hypothetical protein|nr:hypothetical protein [Synergistaceae bacterium]
METAQAEERIRVIAKETDSLIARLETLTSRIDTARANENRELVEYYERQFAEASVEFMNGVETILDEWYALKGTPRPPAGEEIIGPELLDEIHNTVVSIVQGIPAPVPQAAAPMSAAPQQETPESVRVRGESGPSHKVDVRG